MVRQGKFISLRLDTRLIKNLRGLSEKLQLSRSATVRLAVERLIEQFLGPEADIVILDREKFDTLTRGLSKRLTEEISQEIIQKAVKQVQESPEIQKLIRAAKEGKLKIEKKQS